MSQQTMANGHLAPSSELEQPPARMSRWLRSLADYAPTAIVLVMLCAVAYFGHRHDWKLPKLFAGDNGAASADAQPWCAEHGVPEAQCVECRPNLLPKPTDFGWCQEHGVSQCVLCHPEVAQTKEPARVVPEDRERAMQGLSSRPRAENNPRCTLYRRRIQFASLEAIKKVGLDVEPVDRSPIDEVVITNGEITYDQTRVAHLPAKSGGSIWRVDKKMGDRVVMGEVLALVEAAEVGRAKAEFLEALAKVEFATATKKRLLPLSETGAVAESRLLETETAIREARSRILRAQQALVNLGLPVSADEFQGQTADQIAAALQFHGLPESLLVTLDHKATTSNLLPLRASFDGIIVDSDVVPGEVVDTTKPLFTLADTSRMWLTLDVPSEEMDYVAVGQAVRFRTSGRREAIVGRIAWISTQTDTQTRTVKVRAVLENAEGKLRDKTFGTGEIVLRSEPNAVVVPSESVQWDGSCQVVFVRDKDFFASQQSPKLFYPRPVRVGARTNDFVEILAGVWPGEIVVTKGSGVLRGELLKNNLGAG